MRRFVALLGLPLLAVAACAPVDSAPSGDRDDHRWEAFHQRAVEVAEAWHPGPGWTSGYVPLQDPTVLVGDPDLTPDLEMALAAGWYRDQIEIPPARPAAGTIRFPDGTLTVPLVSAAEAYRQLDQGDPPPCEGRPKAPVPTVEPGPDGSVSASAAMACIPLTVTAVTLGTVSVRTSRGMAEVPAWLFTVAELTAPVARVAVAPQAVTAPPEPTAPARPGPDEVVAANQLRDVDGATVTYLIGVGACDTGITPLVQEHDDVVVIGGGVVRSTGVCTEQLKLEPVTVTLAAPLGTRAVLDVLTGRVLTVQPR
ncbi:hypothetical protein E1193_11125 [Micromonospora sp. KC606]|uniref:hypothetical protein n=1 Tax=Micromonospora sp. KC606 TaxID=2530379 RepID=UPI001049F108|nr:hypothetical protein [Micromonospora sp. KC606]TDC82637.1 hypothetical protein E1193_11125 [Micromonospora sp. KC606]